jgi:hypothetical protein
MLNYTEAELLDELKDNLRQAAEECDKIAIHPFRGFVYDSMRKRLKIIEKLCNQVGKYRDGDCRWFPIGLSMNAVHNKAGDWLRNTQSKESRDKAIPLFQKLADNLRKLHFQVVELQFKATGRIGPILPKVLEGPHRQNRPVQVKLPSGLLIPEGVRYNAPGE